MIVCLRRGIVENTLLLCLNHYKPHQEIEFYSVAASAIDMAVGVIVAMIGLLRRAGKAHLA